MPSVTAVISDADLSEFAVYEGDCVNIAVALQRVFEGQLVAAYAGEVEFLDGEPAHFAVRIGGTLYDGGGTTSEEALRDRAFYGISEQDYDDIIVTDVPQPDRKLHNPDRVEKLIRIFESSR
jgi:hypothetical protein